MVHTVVKFYELFEAFQVNIRLTSYSSSLQKTHIEQYSNFRGCPSVVLQKWVQVN